MRQDVKTIAGIALSVVVAACGGDDDSDLNQRPAGFGVSLFPTDHTIVDRRAEAAANPDRNVEGGALKFAIDALTGGHVAAFGRGKRHLVDLQVEP